MTKKQPNRGDVIVRTPTGLQVGEYLCSNFGCPHSKLRHDFGSGACADCDCSRFHDKAAAARRAGDRERAARNADQQAA